jgi:hypothetical protein
MPNANRTGLAMGGARSHFHASNRDSQSKHWAKLRDSGQPHRTCILACPPHVPQCFAQQTPSPWIPSLQPGSAALRPRRRLYQRRVVVEIA